MADKNEDRVDAAGAPEVRRSGDDNIAVGRVDTSVHDETEKLELSAETYATILAKNKPNPLGSGYIRLYILSAAVFLCSTMNGASAAGDKGTPRADTRRLRRVLDGVHQRAAQLHALLWASGQGKRQHGHRLCHFPGEIAASETKRPLTPGRWA